MRTNVIFKIGFIRRLPIALCLLLGWFSPLCVAQVEYLARTQTPHIRHIDDRNDPFVGMLHVRWKVAVAAAEINDRETTLDMWSAEALMEWRERYPDEQLMWEHFSQDLLLRGKGIEDMKFRHCRSTGDHARMTYKIVTPDKEVVYISQFVFVTYRKERGAWRIDRFGPSSACAHCSPEPLWSLYPEDPLLRLPGEPAPR